MCGIAGLITSMGGFDSTTTLHKMSNSIKHRGPDDSGFFETNTRCTKYHIGLAHRRLSIIDLATGHQPLCNSKNNLHIVFNGEIYNYLELREDLIKRGYQFKTSSDTEVILHAYDEFGVDCLELLRGMFAFAIWDSNLERLFIARDRFGKKPLYFYLSSNLLAFASELKSILNVPVQIKNIDYDAIYSYFIYRYVPGPKTLFKDISKLSPGSYLIWKQGTCEIKSYYNPPDCSPKIQNNRKHEGDIPQLFLNQLEEAVKVRMISDVPFGAFLSGGIDSSAIVALMSKNSSKSIQTFSVGFLESNYNELSYAKTVSEEFKTEHHELFISENEIINDLQKLIRFRDAPISEPSDIPIYHLSKEAGKTVKMVLTGEGSDELLGGYPKHLFEVYAPYYHLIPRIIRNNVIERTINILPYSFRRWKTAIQSLNVEDYDERMARWFGALTTKECRKLLSIKSNLPISKTPKNCDVLRNILCFDQTNWLPDNLLERGDRMTMAASIEARMPFMDHLLYDFVASLPNKYRINGRSRKWILRECMKNILPHNILSRSKVGFRVPINEWFKSSMKEYLYDHLISSTSQTKQYYQTDYLKKILHQHTSGRHNHEKLLWALLNLEIWHREYVDN